MSEKMREVSEGNKLIAEFMGVGNDWRYRHYNISWDHIMPVIEKIEEETDYHIQINGFVCTVFHDGGGVVLTPIPANNRLQSVWEAAVSTIKYHNSQITPNPKNEIR